MALRACGMILTESASTRLQRTVQKKEGEISKLEEELECLHEALTQAKQEASDKSASAEESEERLCKNNASLSRYQVSCKICLVVLTDYSHIDKLVCDEDLATWLRTESRDTQNGDQNQTETARGGNSKMVLPGTEFWRERERVMGLAVISTRYPSARRPNPGRW